MGRSRECGEKGAIFNKMVITGSNQLVHLTRKNVGRESVEAFWYPTSSRRAGDHGVSPKMNDIRINEWSKLKFSDPAEILPQLRELQLKVANSNLNDKIRNLRTNKLKTYREGWEAALFCYGMSNIIGTKVYVVPYEASDYDAIAMWLQNEVQHFTPIQIKEIVHSDLNPQANINTEIAKLNRYSDSKETTFLFHVNKAGKLDLQAIEIPKLNIGSLWLIGAVTPDQSKWFVAGDMLNNPTYIEYEYPNG